jgi:hypothetical protein
VEYTPVVDVKSPRGQADARLSKQMNYRFSNLITKRVNGEAQDGRLDRIHDIGTDVPYVSSSVVEGSLMMWLTAKVEARAIHLSQSNLPLSRTRLTLSEALSADR